MIKHNKHIVTPLEKSSHRTGRKYPLSFQTGFTLVELMITMVVFVIVIAAGSQIFTGLLTQFKQQSKITETNIEGIIGLEMLRQDIEHVGFGLPWVIPSTSPSYNEAASTPSSTFNDCSGTAPCNPPRAIISGNSMTYASPNNIFDGSDYLVIKATNVARNATSQKWTYLRTGNIKTTWTTPDGNPHCNNVNKEADCTTKNTVRTIVISPGNTETNNRTLVIDADTGSFFASSYIDSVTDGFDPDDATNTHIIYGVDPDSDLRMPFNRADYYVNQPTTNMPQRCAINTGILYKATVNHDGGGLSALPLLDCVADMQVMYRLDMNDDGVVGTNSNADGSSISTTESATAVGVQATMADAALIRNRLKEVRVYILAHEGQKDTGYTFNNFTGTDTCATCIRVGESATLGRDFDISGITDYLNYRWKLYTIVEKPNNLE